MNTDTATEVKGFLTRTKDNAWSFDCGYAAFTITRSSFGFEVEGTDADREFVIWNMDSWQCVLDFLGGQL
jgi:hypothetical protein